MKSEARYLLRLRQVDVAQLEELLAHSAPGAASRALKDLAAGPRFAGRYRVGAAALDELRHVLQQAPPSASHKRIRKRLSQAIVVEASGAGKLPQDRQSQLTGRPGDSGERKRVRHVTSDRTRDF